jgi:hypothetical protein
MVGFNTCENWEKGLFFLRETLERNDKEATVANDMPVVLYEEMDEEELKSIRAIQKENGSNLRVERVRKAKGYFFKKLDQTVHEKLFIQTGVNELEHLLYGAISKRKLVFTSTVFGYILERNYLNGIPEFYKRLIEMKDFENYDFIESPTRFDGLNRSSVEIWTYALYDMLKWLKEMESGKLNELEKLKKKKNFIIALSFANGDIYRWVKEERMSARECAAKLKLPSLHPFISETLNKDSVSPKCLYSNKKLVRNLKDYCDFYGLEVDKRFEALSKES